jgi:hypothetical protein
MKIVGDFYESTIDVPEIEANYGDGLELADGTDGGIISNVTVRNGNLSRNRGYGLRLTDQDTSVDVLGTSFIENAKGGIYANAGIRNVRYINGENTGLSLIVAPNSNYMTKIRDCELSSNGVTTAPGGKPAQFLINYGGNPAKLLQDGNVCTYYGSGTSNMQVRAPAGTPPS